MLKKLLITAFFVFAIFQSANADERFKGGISFDYDENEVREVQSLKQNLPFLSKDFIDLNYSIEYKPINLLGVDEFKVKKAPRPLKFVSNSGYTPDNYEISLQTGKTTGKIDPSNKLETLLRQHPEDVNLLFAYAIQLKNEGFLERALEAADKAIETDPDFALGHFLKGDILRTMERFKEAANEYIYTTQINPYCSDAYYNIAKILELLDDKELALDYYKTAYQINPNDLEIRDIILKHYIEL